MRRATWPLLLIGVLVAACAPSGAASLPPSPTLEPAPTSAPPLAASTPSATELPSATGATEDLAAGLPYYCGNGETFDIASLSGPTVDTSGSDPAAAIVPSIAAQFGFDAGPWWSVYRSDTTAEFLGRSAGDRYDYVVLKFINGAWKFWVIGGCGRAHYLGSGSPAVEWWIDRANPPKPTSTTLRVLARDLCPRTFATRSAKPLVRYGTTSILIVVTAKSPKLVCGKTQTATLTVALTESIGSRTLLDGSTWPGRDPLTVPSLIPLTGG